MTAETVMVLPLLAAVTLALAWLLSLAVTEVRLVDAAREVARASARDDSGAAARALGRRVAPAGSTFHLSRGDGAVRVEVTAEVRLPAGLLAFLPPVRLHADAVAATEQT